MQTTIRRAFAATLIAFAAVLGACGDATPTDATAAGAIFNTGVTFGSGSRSDDTTATTTSTSPDAGSEADSTTATNSGSAAEGGVTFGSGS